MQMEEICMIIYKKILQRLHGRKNYIFYCKFQMGIYYILYNSLHNDTAITLDLLTLTFYFRLQAIHEKNFIHRDFHSGNILVEIIENEPEHYLIGDLGLSQPASNTLSNNEIYGVTTYVATEIFKGVKISKAYDIYSMGMIMWELTTGCKPFANIEHDANLIYKIINGKRPEITNDTPEDFVNLMKKCWDFDPNKRPSAKEICETVNLWLSKDLIEIFIQKRFIQIDH